LAARLGRLGKKLGVTLPAGDSAEALTKALAELDARGDARLGKRRPSRDPGKLAELGPIQRQLGALLWKHRGPESKEPGLNPVELVDMLEKRLAAAGLVKEDAGE